MEESQKLQSPSLKRTQSHHASPKITQDSKIEELHDLIQSYLLNNNEKTLENILPEIHGLEQELTRIQREKQILEEQNPSEEQMKAYFDEKNTLTTEVQKLSKKVEHYKQKLQMLKLSRKELQEEYRKNQEIKQSLQQKFNLGKKDSPEGCLRLPIMNKKRMRFSQIDNLGTESQKGRQSRESRATRLCFNSINFLKLKEIEKMLDQITVESVSYRLENLIMGDTSQSIRKRVIKNFSVNEFFDDLISQPNVLHLLQKIEKI